jgi:4-diphosphocytidyl-2-C-methyl-D-erythritol kinase
MPVSVRSFGKINLGLYIGPLQRSGFHELRTIYQTIALSDTVKVAAANGAGIEIRCKDTRVPDDETNTCWRVADRMLRTLKRRAKVTIQIEKKLPVQGGLGAASSNAVAAMIALERELGATLAPDDRLAIASAVGSDLPLFLVGGTVLGIGRGEEVFPLMDLPEAPLVVVSPKTGVSTPKAFADWDEMSRKNPGLTGEDGTARIEGFSRSVFSWLTGTIAGVPAKSGDRAEKVVTTPLLDLVRAGIENDFERVVFPQYPELREVKRVLERQGAKYASMSGSGSALYGVFESCEAAEKAAASMSEDGHRAIATTTISRQKYWKELVI